MSITEGVVQNDLRRTGGSMIAIDTNLLVYAHRRESQAHGAAFRILRTHAERRGAVTNNRLLSCRMGRAVID